MKRKQLLVALLVLLLAGAAALTMRPLPTIEQYAPIYNCPQAADLEALEACAEANLDALSAAKAKPRAADARVLRQVYQKLATLLPEKNEQESVQSQLLRGQIGEILYFSTPEFMNDALPQEYEYINHMGFRALEAYPQPDGKYLVIFFKYLAASQAVQQAVLLDKNGVITELQVEEWDETDKKLSLDTAYFNNPNFDPKTGVMGDSSKASCCSRYSLTYHFDGQVFRLKKETFFTMGDVEDKEEVTTIYERKD